MNMLKTAHDIDELLIAPTATAALGAAIETGLLWQLAERPLSGEEVANSLAIPARRAHYWLQLLTVLGILDKSEGRYSPSELTCSAILQTRSQRSWQHLVMDERERTAGVHDLALYIREPGSIREAQGLGRTRDYVEMMQTDLERARDFAHLLFELHQYLGHELNALLDLSNVHRLMDLGGGSGVVSMAFLRKYPGLSSTVIDIENTCIAGRELAAQQGLADRLTYHAADFVKDELPGGFDMVLMCDVTIFTLPLFRKLHACLNDGGSFVLVNHLAPEENVLPLKRLRWGFLDSLEDPEFSALTIAQIKDLLVEAGFSVLPGVQALSDKRLVIQAIKKTRS